MCRQSLSFRLILIGRSVIVPRIDRSAFKVLSLQLSQLESTVDGRLLAIWDEQIDIGYAWTIRAIIPFGRAFSASRIFESCARSSHLPRLLAQKLCCEIRSLDLLVSLRAIRALFFLTERRNDKSDLEV
jgi:hypothetical protein